jgi:hypothetical protein
LKFKLIDDGNYPLADNHHQWEATIEHTQFYTPCGISSVWLEGLYLVRIYDVEFQESHSYEQAIQLAGGSISLVDVLQFKIANSRFYHQSSRMAGGAIAIFSAFRVTDLK